MKHIAEAGDLIAGRFRIVHFIAEGGMGEVYEAEDEVLHERVALKFLNRRNIGNERVAKRFRREILLARKVTHANVCRLFDVFQHPIKGSPDVTFVTMELLPGETLEEHLQRCGPMSEEEALPIVRQLAEGLGAAHGAGVIHRDFKPTNVILVPNEGFEGGFRAVITDFGLARSITRPESSSQSPLTGEMSVVGTVDYMSPEQLMGHEVTPTSDIYAFGVVLYEMMTGKRPHSAPNPVALLAKRVSEPPLPPRAANPEVSEHWENVILQCLVKDPLERLDSGWEVLAALTGEKTPFGPTASGTIPRPPRWMMEENGDAVGREVESPPAPSSGRIGLAAVALLVIVGLVAFLLWYVFPSVPIDPWSQTPRQLTTDGGLEIDPAFSPDGQRIAYSSDREDGFQIWIADLRAGGKEFRVSRGSGLFFEPTWSPDGRHLAYHSRDRGGIWRIDADGNSAAEPLTSFGSRPAWSPDGRQLVFQSASSPQLSDTTAPALATSTLWTLDLSGDPPRPEGEPRQLSKVGHPAGGHGAPAWSPNGRFLAFSVSTYGRSQIWGLDVASGETFRLAGGQLEYQQVQSAYDPVFSVDGKTVYFSAGSRHVNGLWWVPVSTSDGRATGKPTQIRNLGLASIRQLTLSPDGQRIAYLAMNTGSELWQQSLDPLTLRPRGEASPLTKRGGRNNRPRFSSDGSKLAFDHWKPGNDIDVWSLDLGSQTYQQITSLSSSDSQAQWLPGDESIAFHSDRQGERNLWVASLKDAEGEHQSLVPLPEDVFWTALSPDGNSLAYHSSSEGTLSLWRHDLASGERQVLVSLDDLQDGVDSDLQREAFLGFPCWSPDGLWLAFQYKRSKDDTQVMLVGRDGLGLKQLTDVEGENWPYSFSPDGDKIAFAAQRQGQWNLWWVSRSTGLEQQLTSSPQMHQYMRYPTISPTGDLLVFELAQSTGDIFLVESEEVR